MELVITKIAMLDCPCEEVAEFSLVPKTDTPCFKPIACCAFKYNNFDYHKFCKLNGLYKLIALMHPGIKVVGVENI